MTDHDALHVDPSGYSSSSHHLQAGDSSALKPRRGSHSADRKPDLAAPQFTGSSSASQADIELSPIGTTPAKDSLHGGGSEQGADEDAVVVTTRQDRLYLVACCSGVVVMGWNDGSTGPLVLRLEQYYNVGFAILSLIYICGFIGFVIAGLANVVITDRYGFGKAVVIGATCQFVASAIETSAPPFPAFCVAFAINGFGVALMNAQVNTFVASMRNSAPKLGILHACYGAGAFLSPFAATQFAQLPHWSYQYIVSMCLAVFEIAAMAFAFRFKPQDALLGVPRQEEFDLTATHKNKYAQIFRLKSVHILAFFVLFYAGLEVTIAGWSVTYLIQVRGGGPSTGYVSSGFFGGLALGRVVLLWVNKKLGTRRVIYVYGVIVMVLELIVWFVPSVIGDAIAVSIEGLLLGPMFPLLVGTSREILPQPLLAGSIGWIASFGQAGSALFPFMTGAIAQRSGIKVLEPLLVAMTAVCLGLWFILPFTTTRKVN